MWSHTSAGDLVGEELFKMEKNSLDSLRNVDNYLHTEISLGSIYDLLQPPLI